MLTSHSDFAVGVRQAKSPGTDMQVLERDTAEYQEYAQQVSLPALNNSRVHSKLPSQTALLPNQ